MPPECIATHLSAAAVVEFLAANSAFYPLALQFPEQIHFNVIPIYCMLVLSSFGNIKLHFPQNMEIGKSMYKHKEGLS